MSGDFRQHVIGYLLAELIELHDRDRFEVIGVSFGIDDRSDIRARLVGAFDRFIDVIAVSDAEVAKLVRDSDVDIAVDLMAHTRDARMRIFAHRPAPIQVNYFGYAGTMGAAFFDYIVGDRIVLPFEHAPYYSEHIVQLPEGFFANDSRRVRNSPAAAEALKTSHPVNIDHTPLAPSAKPVQSVRRAKSLESLRAGSSG